MQITKQYKKSSFLKLIPYSYSLMAITPSRLLSRRLYMHTAATCVYKEPNFFDRIEKTNRQFSEPTYVNMLEVNAKLKELVRGGNLNNARRMFDEMPHRDVVTWTNMISGYVNASYSSEGLSLFSRLWVESEIELDPFVLSIALKACGVNLNLIYGQLIHGYSIKTDFFDSVFVSSSILDMYMKTGRIWEGCRVFDEMPARNVVSWTAVITGLVRAGYNYEGLRYFSEMSKCGEDYDTYVFAIALKACADAEDYNYGRELHAQALKRGYNTTSFVANSIAAAYNKCGRFDYGLRFFERMTIKNVVSWTTVITWCFHMGLDSRGIQTFRLMRDYGVRPNEYTFAALISSCANLTRIDWGEQLHAHVLIIGVMDYLSVGNSLVTLYSRCGRINSGVMIFNHMKIKDIVSWSTIIAGYAQGGYDNEVFEYLSQMRREGLNPNEFALASALSVCGNMAILEQGRQLHAQILSVGLEDRAMVSSGLINMYSKCGSLIEASKIFDGVKYVDIVSWTAMITGYAEHGRSKESIDLFEQITEAGVRPDSVTFIGVLNACTHAGLVDLGFHYFELMSEKYKISPSKEHYGCMIDLLCRAGRLNDAENMIEKMPHEKDDVVWSTLLRACRVHGDVVRGRRAAEKVLEHDPDSAGAHITLANICSAQGKWGEAATVRTMMKLKGVIKEPGWSWIKTKDQVSAFVAGDRKHPEGDRIYGVLDLIASGAEISFEDSGGVLFDDEG